MFFEKQISDHSRLLLSPMQMAAHRGDHLGPVDRTALAQGIGLHILIEQFIRVQFGTVTGQADQAQALGVVRHEAFGDRGSDSSKTASSPARIGACDRKPPFWTASHATVCPSGGV